MNNITNRLIQQGSPFELQDVVINGIPCKVFPHGPKTLQDVFLKTAAFNDKEFIVCSNNRLSFGLVSKQAKQLAMLLQKQYHVAKKDRVALLMDNSPEWIIAFIAIYFAGAVAVTIHADAEKPAVLKALEMTDCSLILSDINNANKLDKNDNKYIVLLVSNNNELQNENYNKNRNPNLLFYDLSNIQDYETSPCINEIPKPEPDDEALISFTSGTTGTPKGVVLSHRNLTTGLMNMMLGGFMMKYRIPKTGKQINVTNSQPCSLLLSPLSHIGGYSQIMLMCYLSGKIVLMNEWESNKAATLVEKEKVRSINGASVYMVRELLGSNECKGKLKTLTNLNINGVALNKGFLQYVAENLPSVTVATGYGMTETCGSISNVTGTELLNNPNWIGPVLPSVDIKVVNESENEQSSGNLGEICIRGAMVMKEYCSDPDKTNAALKNGWLKTGDSGYFGLDGNLYITDRIKDVIVCNNQRVSAGELERLASNCSMVNEAIAISIPSSERCEKIFIVIQTNKSLQFDEYKLEQKLALRFNEYSDDIKIILVDSLPRTASGKVNRNELRKQITGY